MALQHRNNRHIRANCFIIRIRCIRVFQWMVKCREKLGEKEVGGEVRKSGREYKYIVGKLGSRVVGK